MKRFLPFALAVPLLLVGCSTDGNPAGEEVTTEAATQTTDRDSPGYTNVLGSAGETITAGGITITVDNVTESTSIEEHEAIYPQSEISTRKAPAEQKFVEVSTTVLNSSDRPWDLTCGGPIHATLADDQGNLYFSMRESYLIPGNPECNYMLNPGLSSNMTWRFEMPANTPVHYFGFSEADVNLENPWFIDVSEA